VINVISAAVFMTPLFGIRPTAPTNACKMGDMQKIGPSYIHLAVIVCLIAILAATLEVPSDSPVLGSITVMPFFASALLMKYTLKVLAIPTAPMLTTEFARVSTSPDFPFKSGLVTARRNIAVEIADVTAIP
jgi:predicted lysophospholipase L1 biosynthesis ABC-type transport system permease subunit